MEIKPDKLFELVIAILLKRNGYRVGAPVGRYLEGRGGHHQLDCLAIYPVPAPFVFPIRLVVETKLYNPNKTRNEIGIKYVRNLHSTLIDLEQTLPQDRSITLDERWEENITCNYQGAIFSTSGFSEEAARYANAFGINTINMAPCFENNESVYDSIHSLAEVVEDCIKRSSPAFSDEAISNEDAFKEITEKKKYSSLSIDGKKEFTNLVEFIIQDCIEFPKCGKHELKKIQQLKMYTNQILGSIEGNVIALYFKGNNFQKLRKEVIKSLEHKKEDEDSFKDGSRFEHRLQNIVNVELYPPFEEHQGIYRLDFFIRINDVRIKCEGHIPQPLLASFKERENHLTLTIPVDIGCYFHGIVEL